MLKGKIIFFNVKSQFGFIKGEDGIEYYVHAKQVTGILPEAGDEVEFETRQAKRGPEAWQVKKTNSPAE